MKVRIKVCLSRRLSNQSEYPDCEAWFRAEERACGPVKFVMGRSVEDDDDEAETPIIRLLMLSSADVHATIARQNHVYELNSAGFIGCLGTKPEVYGGSESLSGEFPATSGVSRDAQTVVSAIFCAWPVLEAVTVDIDGGHQDIDEQQGPKQTKRKGVGLSSLSEEYDRCGRKRSWASRRLSRGR
ncbi:hypothetical protein [Acetobacter malorum]|uniref:hypothetical protein n=1 Tax=Acetobacter malorum TaxID=178901 RepID=UPI000AFF4DB5|nr:hypothetical protein [Acetobacter malorum]